MGAAARASHHTGLCVQAVLSQHMHDFPGKVFRGASVLHCSENTDTAAMGVGLGKLVAAAEPLMEAPVRKDSRGPCGVRKMLGHHLLLIICPPPRRKMAG